MGLRDDVEVLAAGHLGPHRLDDRQGTLKGRLVETGRLQHLRRPHHQQVAEQDRPGLAEGDRVPEPAGRGMQGLELPVGGRTTPAQVGGVHHVVVHQRAHVQHIQTRRGSQQRPQVGFVR